MKTAKSRGLGLVLVCFALVASGCAEFGGKQWYKGNTHTHTWWSDGDSPPEVVVKWYVEHGYNFLVLSDHNKLSEGEKWVVAEGKRSVAIEKYENEFPAETIQKRQTDDGKTEYRLKTLDEIRAMYDRPGEFIMIPGEEISDHLDKAPVHLGAVNIKELVPPQGGKTITEVMQRNIDAVLAQREAMGQPMFPHINHPNFKYAITAEDMAGLRGEQFFEVYNGHNGVNNRGDDEHLSTERIWDVVLSRRLGMLSLPVMYGMATDDAHSHVVFGKGSNPGRGWVMVRADKLTPEALIEAMEKGDFYSSTGVTLRRVEFKDGALSIHIQSEPDVTYRTQFIGTPRQFDKTVTTRPASDGHVVYSYSDDIGMVFAEVAGEKVSYKLTGDELYVRAKVISSRKHPNPQAEGDMEVAWTQPVTGQ